MGTDLGYNRPMQITAPMHIRSPAVIIERRKGAAASYVACSNHRPPPCRLFVAPLEPSQPPCQHSRATPADGQRGARPGTPRRCAGQAFGDRPRRPGAATSPRVVPSVVSTVPGECCEAPPSPPLCGALPKYYWTGFVFSGESPLFYQISVVTLTVNAPKHLWHSIQETNANGLRHGGALLCKFIHSHIML